MEHNHINLKKKTISGVFWKGMERICAQLVSTVVSIVLARLLIPEDYSVVGITAIFFSFCNVFISGGLNTALIQKKDADELDFSTVLSASLLMAGVFYAVMFFAAPYLAELYSKPILIPAVRVMALTFFISAYKSVVGARVTSALQFRKFFWSTFIGTAVSAVVGITLAFKGFGPWALIAQQMSNSTIDALVLTLTSRYRARLRFSFPRFRRLFSFGGRIFAASIISVIYDQTKPLIVGIRFSTVDLAYYNKGQGYPSLITSIASNTLASSLFPVMAKVQDDRETVLRMTRRYMQVASFLVFPLMMGFLGISENFVRIVLTDKWLPIVPYIMVFCSSSMLKPIQDGNLQAIRALGRSDIILKLEIIKKTSYFIVILLFVLFTDSPILLAVSGIVTSLLASLFNTQPNRKLIGYRYRLQLMDLLPNFITSALMGAVVFSMNALSINRYLLVLLQIVAGVLLYCGLNIAIKNESFFYCLNIVKGVLRIGNNQASA